MDDDAYVPFVSTPARQPLRQRTNTLVLRHAKQPPPQRKAPSREDRQLTALRDEAAEGYDAGLHESMLREVWVAARCGGADNFSRVSASWMSLGFQQADPSTDLRGCGVLGLRQLLHFCQSGGAAVVAAATLPEAPFPLAGASLSVTLALCKHLQLLPTAASAQRPCLPPTLSHFLRFSAEMQPARALDLMHAACLRGLAELWQSMQCPGLTLMHFPEALRLMGERLAEALASAQPPWRLSEVLQALRAVGGGEMHTARDGCTMAELCAGGVFGGGGGSSSSWTSSWFLG